MKRSRPIPERFWEKVEKRGPDECWGWKNAKRHYGYGCMWMGYDFTPTIWVASRISLWLEGIEVPKGMVIDHICKNTECVNPAHLRVVTQRVNSTENSNSPMAANSKRTHCAGCGNPLSGDNVKVIRRQARISKAGKRVGAHWTRKCLTCYPGTRTV